MRVFDEYSQKYDEWYEKPFGRSAFELELTCLKGLFEGGLSLEVGVGSGRFAQALGIRYGVDTSMELLKIARRRGTFGILAKAEELPFKEGTFKTVLMVVSICFFEDPIQAFKEARRVLKREGSLLLGLVLSESPWAEFYRRKSQEGHPIYQHARFYSYNELRYMLEKAGFRIDTVRTTLFDEPQDVKPVKDRRIEDGYYPDGGFFCVRAI
ncbi:class I SAM-dependent methyltransferase [Thermocrinis minervae]|uniref:Ubiquinone/menaquinone biosynthesis C-methylase UbiE n=1 Tax=Thermocrinis minervae TaxID=381751 RepID=A0A1M6TKJ4_9AQUI|nr:class I SAM-dependent methyltransferase [Thermocrinis minervae]SHK57505.1 Ubiquinone/menaquinone biosynthesis C-methylase UbiE [Thermocrinis minervae]